MRPRESSEESSRMLDPHRGERREEAATEIAGRLLQKGVDVSEEMDASVLADLLAAVERFEDAVIRRGGDPMVNMPESPTPQDPAFVLPRRRDDESLEAYTRHVNSAAEMLEEPPSAGNRR